MSAFEAVEINKRVLVYPSAMVRPVPSFMIAVPDGWQVAEMPQAVLTIGTPELVNGVWVNASVVHERVMPSMGLRVAAQASWTRLKDISPDAEVNGEEKIVTFGERETYLRGASIPASGETPAFGQLHSIFFGPEHERPTVDLFQIVCTGPLEGIDDLIPSFLEIIGSFAFT